jgi:tRNA A-37 threonylcarbamoyl transferase component Bud32
MRNIELNPEYESLCHFVECLPENFDGVGRLIFNGRNKIRRATVEGRDIVIKRFRKMDFFKQIVYTFFRKDKAYRSYHNAMTLLEKGFCTPKPVAYVAFKKGMLLSDIYYICEYTDYEDIKTPLIDSEPFDEKLAMSYARFVARLHESGVLHKDLNPTNVIYKKIADGEYDFQLIDVNRMRFYEGSVPKAECMENLTLFWWLTDVYRFVLKAYAEERKWSEEDYVEAVRVKQQHDRRWIRRKRFTAMFKHKKK